MSTMKHGRQSNVISAREIELVDFAAPEVVEVAISKDGTSVWINVNGVCAWRATRIGTFALHDDRPPVKSTLVTNSKS